MSTIKQKNNHFSFYIIFPLVKFWQLIRPLRKALNLGDCRFYPSCSNYYLDAISTHGLIIGSFLGIKRICKCNPLFEGGIDPVPTKVYGLRFQSKRGDAA